MPNAQELALIALAVVAVGLYAWRSWRFERIARMMVAAWNTKVRSDAQDAEISREREQQELHLKSQTLNEQAELERVKLARARAEEYNAMQRELTGKGRELLNEAREIGQELTDRIPARHPATVQADGRARPPAAPSGNGGRHRTKDPAEAPS